MRIRTNVMAVNTWRNLDETSRVLSKTLERLSSGLRINRAADDAAGLAISEKMRAQIRGLNQATRNAQDGISLLQTAEGALNEYHAILQRMRELSVQAASETLTDQDRAAIQDELNQLIREADRIAVTTEFNRHKLLDGSFESRQLHIGANTNQVITFAIGSLRVQDVGAAWGEGAAVDTSSWNFTANGLVINGVTIDLQGATTMSEVLARINAQSELTGVTASQVEKTVVNLGAYTAPTGSATLTINGIDIQVDSTVTTVDQLADRINQVQSKTGVTASVEGGSLVLTDASGSPITVQQSALMLGGLADTNVHTFAAALRLAAKPGTASVAVNGADRGALGLPAAGVYATGTAIIGTNTGDLTVTADQYGPGLNGVTIAFGPDSDAAIATSWDSATNTLTVTADWDDSGGNAPATLQDIEDAINAGLASAGFTGLTVSLSVTGSFDASEFGGQSVLLSGGSSSATTATTVALSGHTVNTVDVRTAASAETSVTLLDYAIQQVSEHRSALGALQNRLEHTISNLMVASENLSAAESRIRDADMAQEMMEFVRNQILLQSGTAMLAQANAVPQTVLQLLA